jgi:hypothetical protein
MMNIDEDGGKTINRWMGYWGSLDNSLQCIQETGGCDEAGGVMDELMEWLGTGRGRVMVMVPNGGLEGQNMLPHHEDGGGRNGAAVTAISMRDPADR